MATNSNSNNEKTQKDGVALVVGGLFILTLVFATYNYFNKGSITNDAASNTVESEVENDSSEVGDLNGDGVVDMRNGDLGTGGPITEAMWVATDYNQGDISGNSYTVKSGDTLWEIADAIYGDGTQWTKILEANSGSIGTLPNGQQALIQVGQTLVLP